MLGGRSLYNYIAVSCQLCVSLGGLMRIFIDIRGGLCNCVVVRCQLYSPGGSMSCSQMPKGGLLIIWQLDASSYSSSRS
jgi:hypothetical protein